VGLRAAIIERISATVDETDEAGVVSLEVTVDIRSRTGRRWAYSYGPASVPVQASPPDLKAQLDFFARDRLEDLLDDVQADGYDGPRRAPGRDLEWLITEAAARTLAETADTAAGRTAPK
jgi:hypothetical protein